MRISARHEGDLNRQLTPFSKAARTALTLVLTDTASSVAVQHTAWMLANLAVRLEGYIEGISIYCPKNIPVHSHVFPFEVDRSDFGLALLAALQRLELLPVEKGTGGGIQLHIGPGPAVGAGWRVHGHAWCGGITRAALFHGVSSPLPFGPYIAACFATAEIFKRMRMRSENYVPGEGFYDAWNLQPTATMAPSNIEYLPECRLISTLAGVGAVGNAFLHTMHACPTVHLRATTADNDKKGIDITNLNRYVLFGKRDLGHRKPDAAHRLLHGAHLQLIPWNDVAENLPDLGHRVLSAVDTNTSREGIQFRFPARIISASTSDLRAEVLRCGPPGKGACLRCYNPPEALPSDAELIAKMLGSTADDLARFCAEAGVSIEDGRSWLGEPKCGQAGERLLSLMRQQDAPGGAFSVGFTSVFAGTLLAAEFIKDSLGLPSALNALQNRCVFQFFDVLSLANATSFLRIDPKCPICNQRSAAFEIWEKRYHHLELASH